MKTIQSATLSLDAERLERSLYSLTDVYRNHKAYIKGKYKVNALEMEIIQLIMIDGKKRMKEIGDHFNVKLSTLTSIIDKIERQKLVKRVNSKEDRRVVFLDVTKKGERLYKDYSRYMNVFAQMVRRSLEEDHFEALLLGLDTMSQLATEKN